MKPFIIVLGNEKGGSGKTTTASNLLFSLIYDQKTVSILDLDIRQLSLKRYIQNRETYNKEQKANFSIPDILKIDHWVEETDFNKLEDHFNNLFDNTKTQFVLIDTPGSNTALSTVAHSFADLIITPINDSFIDLDLIAKITGDNVKKMSPSLYSLMIWEQRRKRFKRDSCSIEWVILRNRLSNLDSSNRRAIEKTLAHLSKNLNFRIVAGFSERIIYRALFPYGLTLLDIFQEKSVIPITTSHIAARSELRTFYRDINIFDKKNGEFTIQTDGIFNLTEKIDNF